MKLIYSAVAVTALLCACAANENRGLPGIDIVSDDGKFYCLVEEEEMAKLTDDEDVNQAIVVIDVK